MASINKCIKKVAKTCGLVLKEKQEEVLTLLCENRSVFANLPTGYGKSETFGLLPLIQEMRMPGTTFTCLVVTPLKAISADQLSRWTARGLRCVELQKKGECDEMVMEATKDALDTTHLIFTSPEALQDDFWWETLRQRSKVSIKLVCVDESHTLLPWGYGFREDFLKVPEVLSILPPRTPVLCLTGTASTKMIAALENAFELKFDVVSLSPDRPNLHLAVEFTKDSFEGALNWLMLDLEKNLEKTEKTIIYCSSVSKTGELFEEMVVRLGFDIYGGKETAAENLIVEEYHSTSTDDTKERVLRRFRSTESTLRCVISTVAFGMGVDIPDVRRVIHWGPPNDLHTYWQECGRCGRDQQPSKCILYRYDRSSPTNIVQEDMQLVLSAAKNKTCIRRCVLQQLQVKGTEMDGWKPTKHCCSVCNP